MKFKPSLKIVTVSTMNNEQISLNIVSTTIAFEFCYAYKDLLQLHALLFKPLLTTRHNHPKLAIFVSSPGHCRTQAFNTRGPRQGILGCKLSCCTNNWNLGVAKGLAFVLHAMRPNYIHSTNREIILFFMFAGCHRGVHCVNYVCWLLE